MIRPKRSVRGAAATIALTSGISVVAPAVLGAAAHAANTQTMYATTDVNVRSASSNSGKVLAVMARGQSVQVTGEKVRGWIPVAVNGTTGWIYQRFLTAESIRPVRFGSDPLPDTMIATVPVNVRDDSANAGKVLTVAERGQEVQVTGRPDGGWLPVSVNGKSGWIYGRYLTTGKSAPAPAKPNTDTKGDSSTSRDTNRPALDNAATRTTSGVNVRTAPSPSGQVIDQLADGASVEVTGDARGNWVQVRANGHTGWVYRTHLSGKVPAAQPIKHAEPVKHSKPAKSTKHAKDGASTHTTSGVNVRTAPTPKASIVTSLAEGTGVKVTGDARGNWVQVRANGHTGWVYRTHLSGKVPAAQPIKHAEPVKHSKPAKSTKHAKDGASTHTTSGVNVRTAPTPKASIVTSLAEGTGVKVTGDARGNWVEVRANGHTGWVYRTHLSGKVPAAQPIKHAEPVKHSKPAKSTKHAKDGASTHTTSGVNVRTAPTPKASIVTSLAEGTGVKVTGDARGNWVEVRANGHTGWVYRTHLSGKVPAAQPIKHAEPVKHSKPAKSTKHAKDGASTHTTSGVNVRTAPTPKASIVTSLAEGTGVKVTGDARGNWVEVRANGHTGWVYRTHLSGKVPAAQPIKHAEPVKHKGGDTSRDTTRPSRHHAKDGDSNKGSGRADARCVASFYDEPQSTASGEQFNPNAMTAAHKSLSLGTHIRVTNVRNGRSVVVRINDRGPYVAGRCVDLSRASFAEIADLGQGTTPITYTVLD